MKFALLGADHDCLELLAAIQQSSSDELIAVYDGDRKLEAEVRNAAPNAVWSDNWESLLHDPVAEVVIVCPWRDRSAAETLRRTEQLRKLVQAAMPLVVIHPGCESILAFEIDMIREDTHSLVLPYCPAKSWLPIRELLDATVVPTDPKRNDQLFVQVERYMSSSPDEIRMQLARDTYTVAQFLGRIQRVNAFGTALRSGPNRLTVHLDGEAGSTAQWSLLSTPSFAADQVRVTTAKGSASAVAMGPRQWKLEVGTESRTLEAPNLAAQLLEELPRRLASTASDDPWSRASRTQEVTELAERSAERGRTLELHHEDHSEEGTFKGVMAVGSCAILMLTVVILIIGSVIEGIRLPYVRDSQPRAHSKSLPSVDSESGEPQAPRRLVWLRLWPVYPIAFFLLLQLLRLAFPEKEKKSSANALPNDSADAGPS